jgi:LysM repeat protein
MSGRTIAVAIAMVLVLALALGATGCCPLIPSGPVEAAEAGPMILINSPGHGEEVTVGEAVQVFATGRDDNKIARMELWADGALVQSQASALPDGTSPFPLMAMWVPQTAGNHTIVVRGYNMNDVSGQASVAVNAVEPPPVPEGCPGVAVFEHTVQAGETVEGIAGGYEVTVEEIVACNPGLDPTAMPAAGTVLLIPGSVAPEDDGPSPDWPPPDNAQQPPDVPQDVEELPGEALPPPEAEPTPGEEAPPDVEEPPEAPEVPTPEEEGPPPVTVTFEALELEVDQHYDNVYCMVKLADADMEQVPETGSFVPVVDNYWDIQAELAGMNSVPVLVTGDIFRVEVECFGWIGIDGWSLGHFVREHGEAEWTGDQIEVQALADDGRWFRVVYRICPDYPCEPRPVPPAPENLVQTTTCPCAFPLSCPGDCPFVDAFAWDWTGDEATIDGFRLYRNDTMLLEDPDPSARVMALPADYFDPLCGEEWNYHVTAYQGPPGVGVESDPSNVLTYTGPACTTSVVVTFDTLYTACIRPDLCLDFTCATCKQGYWIGEIEANGQSIQRLIPLGAPDITSFNLGQSVADLFFGTSALTVELDPAEDLTVGMLILDWDGAWPGGTVGGTTLYGMKTIASGDVATGDYFMFVSSVPAGTGFGVVTLHLEVTP